MTKKKQGAGTTATRLVAALKPEMRTDNGERVRKNLEKVVRGLRPARGK